MFQKIIKYTLLGLASAFLGHSSYTILREKREEKEERMQWGGKLKVEVVKIVINKMKPEFNAGVRNYILNDPEGQNWKNDLIQKIEDQDSDMTIEAQVDKTVNFLWNMGWTDFGEEGDFWKSVLKGKLKDLNVQNPEEKTSYFNKILQTKAYIDKREALQRENAQQEDNSEDGGDSEDEGDSDDGFGYL